MSSGAGGAEPSGGAPNSEDSEQFCGGIAGFQCDDANEFCDLECDIADAGGVCRQVPSACTREYDPVCGCNDETYSNDCERRRAGVGLRGEGECR